MIDEKAFESRYLQRLNPQQREAVTAVDGSILLLATPGSGKTTVLVTRVGYMVCCKGIDPDCILTMTYTRAATKDMKERFVSFFGAEAAAGLQFRTINGVSAKIIEYAGKLHGKSPFTLLENEGELAALIRQIYQRVNKDYAEDSVVKDVRTAIAYIKNMMLDEVEINALQTDIDHFPELYRAYQSELKARRQMDYDDQMVYAHKLLRSMPRVLQHFQDRYRYICVDEAQDTSKIQHEIIRLLAEKSGNLFMVGDEDQSIYGFRAAYPEALLCFEEDHPASRVLLMEENYRSTPAIIELANHFISQNISRHEKAMKAVRSGGNPVHMVFCKNRELQLDVLIEAARTCDRETAILFRNNDSALPLIDLFEKNKIAYNCKNIDDVFFTHKVVVDMLDILRFAYDPQNTELFMKLYYKFGVPVSKKSAQDAVSRSAESGKAVLEELLQVPDIRGYVRDAVIELLENLPLLRKDSAETAIHRIWDGMRYGQYVEQKGFDQGKYYILCMMARGVPSVPDFLEKLTTFRNTLSAHKNSADNKVILSTIHSSKGLEYDSVYLMDVMDGILPSKTEQELETADDRKLYEEERRLCYVGMTRAKNDLYLLRFGQEASFTEESCRYLPVPATDADDVFSSLSTQQLGKAYTDREWGKGVIEAQCGDTFFIRFTDGSLRRVMLDEMIKRRAQITRPPAIPKEPSHGLTAQNQKAPAAKSAGSIRVGMMIRHEVFGVGQVRSIDHDMITIYFKTLGAKRFGIRNCLEKGLLTW